MQVITDYAYALATLDRYDHGTLMVEETSGPATFLLEYDEAIAVVRAMKGATKYGQMLKAQYAAEKQAITATLLADAAGYANYNAANLQYGTLAKLIAGYLAYLPPKRANGERMWWCTLSNGNDASAETIDGHFEFVMRPELAAALEDLRWVKPKE